ncbi:hypothetical protein MATL_G00128200 [Megalops atlanticus]|uniref:Ig-like domain-containing protein n=1 Tax=Megalops atlanticus TaxID=7932 RepID=A0A9D3PV19_MEGAT|nr:hypothetical protein MATL_G00128200 [Megalops atlanticus]
MEYCSMKSVILITTVIFSTQAAVEEIVYGQVGGSVVLQKREKSQLSNRARTTWSFRSTSGEDKNVYSYNPMGVPATGSWIKDRVSVSNTGLSLTINRLTPEDFSVFECEIHDKSKTEKTIYKLYKITVTAYPYVLLATQTLSLTCDVQKSAAKTSVVWTSPQGTNITSSKNPTVKNVSVQHHGVWNCIVDYQGRQTEAKATVSVAVVDFSPSLPQLIYTSLSSTSPLLLPCSLHSRLESSHLSGFIPQSGHWSFTPFSADRAQEGTRAPQQFLSLSQGTPLRWLDNQVNQSALGEGPTYRNFSIVKNIGEEGGIYTCTLEFKGGVKLSWSVRVEVLRVESSHVNPVQEGLAVNITCTLGRPIPSNLEVKWTIPRHSSKILSSSLSSWILSHPRVQKKDEGKWQCELSKGTKVLTRAYMMLKTERAPVNVWLWVSISGAVIVLVLIPILIVIFVRRHKQNLMFRRRRRRTKYCRCKHPQVKGFYKS